VINMIKLEFTEQQLVLIDQGIQHLPHYLAVPLINDINRQIKASPPIVTAAPGDGFDLARGG